MGAQTNLDLDAPAIHAHLTIMQGVIQRMTDNSRSCKVWCVTLVAAILVLVARTGEANHVLIALAPTVLFYVLDAYYLALERGFRRSYNSFVKKVHDGQGYASDLYTVISDGSTVWGTLWAMVGSFSVPPFYLMVVITVVLAWCLIF